MHNSFSAQALVGYSRLVAHSKGIDRSFHLHHSEYVLDVWLRRYEVIDFYSQLTSYRRMLGTLHCVVSSSVEVDIYTPFDSLDLQLSFAPTFIIGASVLVELWAWPHPGHLGDLGRKSRWRGPHRGGYCCPNFFFEILTTLR